jgi:hypothetical protein
VSCEQFWGQGFSPDYWLLIIDQFVQGALCAPKWRAGRLPHDVNHTNFSMNLRESEVHEPPLTAH